MLQYALHMTASNENTVRHILLVTVTVLAAVLLVGSAFYFLYSIRSILVNLIIALILSSALRPLFSFLKRKKFGSIGSAITAIAVAVVILAGVSSLIVAPLINEGSRLVSNAPEIIESISRNTKLSGLIDRYNIAENIGALRDRFFSMVPGSTLPIITGIIGGITSVLSIIIFVFFLLLEGNRIWSGLLNKLPERRREWINATGKKMMAAISGFVSGNLLISFIAGSFTLILLLILKVPYPFALAALVALFDLIPLIGATIATVIVALIALTKGVVIALIVAGILLIYQLVENHFIQPLVYSRSVKLSALLVIIATLIGAELAGILGVLLAIPIAAVIQIAITEILVKEPLLKQNK